MSIINITSALRTQLESANIGLQIADENIEFNSDNVNSFIADFIIPVDTTSMGKGIVDADEEIGIYQITVSTKDGIGRGEAFGIVDKIKTAFKYGSTYTFLGTAVVVSDVKANQGRVSGGRFLIDVSINWNSYIER